MGRWLSPEPLGLDGPNLYHFNFNDPVNGVDVNGLWTWKFWTEEFYLPLTDMIYGPIPGTDNETCGIIINKAICSNKTLGYDLYDIDQDLLYEAGDYAKDQTFWFIVGAAGGRVVEWADLTVLEIVGKYKKGYVLQEIPTNLLGK